MAAGGLDSTEISLLACIFSFLAVLVTIRTRRKPGHDPIDQHLGGDCFPHPVMRGDFKLRHGGSITHE